MNLYVIGWNLSKEHHRRMEHELGRMIEVYPHLDAETLCHHSSPDGLVFTALMHTGDQAASPRRYVSKSNVQFVFYSGLPVNPSGAFLAHRAEDLAAHWDQLDEKLEGMYCVARVTNKPTRLEIQTDILGFEQVFYLRHGNAWIISNSVQLIERVSQPQPLDPLGVSLFLSMGWVGADCTLRAGIKAMPGGQRWIWQAGDIEPRQYAYYPPSKLARQPRQALTPSFIAQLAEGMMQPLYSLGQSFAGDITCPLTGGRDSRLLAALLSRAGVPARYYTMGEVSGGDAEIARQIARILDVPYEVKRITTSDVIEDWDNVCRQIILHSDGMYPFQLIVGVLAFLTPQIDRMDVRIWGVGGEIARGFYNNAQFFLRRHDVADIQRILASKKISSYRGLIRPEGVSLAQDYIHCFVEQRVNDGFAPIDVPDILYAYERVGRRGGKNMRMSMSIRDAFSPFCTRSFIEATFAIPALQRYTEPLHYQLTRFLSPELHRLPFDSKPWRSQQPIVNLLKSYGNAKLRNTGRRIQKRFKTNHKDKQISSAHIVNDTMFDRVGWFEAKREQVREVCLDQKDSMVWNYVDRSMFDRITSSATNSVERSHYLKCLYHITTLFYYQYHRQK